MPHCLPALISRAMGHAPRRRCIHASAGFSLVEVVITAAILALAVGVVLPAATGFGLAALRKETRMLSGTIRATYDEAALTGQIYRLVFDFKGNTVRVESTAQALFVAPGSNALIAAKADVAAGDDGVPVSPFLAFGIGTPPMSDNNNNDDDRKESEKRSKRASADRGAGGMLSTEGAFTPTDKKLKFDDDVHIHDLWVEGMDKPATDGEVYMHFFPHGYTQRAIIHLADGNGRIFALKVAPLTGKVDIVNQYVEMEKRKR